jgi:hypothetical protein
MHKLRALTVGCGIATDEEAHGREKMQRVNRVSDLMLMKT